ncbi:hypothetical protein ACLOJK_012133 [Asimina triloba]
MRSPPLDPAPISNLKTRYAPRSALISKPAVVGKLPASVASIANANEEDAINQPLLFSPFKTLIALQHQKNLGFFKQQKLGSSHARIRQSVAVRCSSNLPSFHDFEGGGDMVRELFGRAEGLLYTIADAAANASDASSDVVKPNRDWFSGITDCLEAVLKDGLSALHVPYAYGFAIIFLTVLVKAATFPLTKKQVESAMAMRSLQPQIKAIQELYSGDQFIVGRRPSCARHVNAEQADIESYDPAYIKLGPKVPKEESDGMVKQEMEWCSFSPFYLSWKAEGNRKPFHSGNNFSTPHPIAKSRVPVHHVSDDENH